MARRSRNKREQRVSAPEEPQLPAVVVEANAWSAREWWIVGILIALTCLIYGQVVGHTFLNYDDPQFITANENVKAGLTPSSIAWSFTSTSIGWYPLTWLSHMLDVQLRGLDPTGHLAMQLILHALTSCLLFAALRALTGTTMRSAFVAALFAAHPLHVESVAWASERKDTLSTLFAMLALLAFAHYARRRTPARIALVCAALFASLMAKQMYVTLPVVLLLLDFWPLRRIDANRVTWRDTRPFLLEKLPLFVATIIGSLLALTGQRALGAVQTLQTTSLGDRIENAFIAYFQYIGKLIWPAKLAVIYPMVTYSGGVWVGAAVALVVFSIGAVRVRHRLPYVTVGWFWYVITLLPVIGIIQIGSQSIADRYMYFPAIGLFLIAVWGAVDAVDALHVPRAFAAVAGAIAVIVLASVAWVQTGYWKNTVTLFSRTIAVTPPNMFAEYTLGQALEIDQPDQAIEHLRRASTLLESALAAKPGAQRPDWYSQSHAGIGAALLMKARTAKTRAERQQAIADARVELQRALVIEPGLESAKRNLELAARMTMESAPPPSRPAYDALLNEAVALTAAGKSDEAVAKFRDAVNLAPQAPEPRIYLALGLIKSNHTRDALAELQRAAALDYASANKYLTRALQMAPSDSNLRDFIQRVKGAS